MQPIEHKTCCRCGKRRPLGDFYLRAKAMDGRTSACKECLAERRRQRRAMSPAEKLAEIEALRERATKTCTACQVTRPRQDFRHKKASRDGLAPRCKSCESAWHKAHYQKVRTTRLEQSAAWFAANRDRKNATSKEWYHAHKEASAEYQRAYNAARPGHRARLVREWRKANPERARTLERAWRDKNRDRLKEQSREARARNPEKYVERSARRRALIAKTTVGPVDLEALWTGACGLCGQPINRALRFPNPASKSLDHIIPLSRDGSHTQDNLQWTHLFCNISKGARVANT